MTNEQYMVEAMKTDATTNRSDRLTNAALGLTGEAGECADVIKKWRFHGHALDEPKLKKELGDVLWYVTQAATEMGWTLGELMDANIAKLRERYGETFSSERSVNRVA